MYYFGTNLENRFSVDHFWPSQEQSHRIPYERDEIRDEVMRFARETRERETRRRLEEVKLGGGVVRREGGGEEEEGGAKEVVQGGTQVKS